MTITGKNVRLRALERDDLARCTCWVNDPEVVRYTTVNSPLSFVMEEDWFQKLVADGKLENQVLAIETCEGDEWVHIGNCGLHNIEPITNEAEFGIMIGEKEYWNRGLGREAAKLILKHGFEDLNLNRIYLHVVAENIRGIKAYTAVGFVQEGVLREALYKNGKYNDIIVMSMLHSEWKGL